MINALDEVAYLRFASVYLSRKALGNPRKALKRGVQMPTTTNN